MNYYDQVNNQFITYSYNRAQEIIEYGNKIKDQIINEQPSSAVPNKPLNLTTYIDHIQRVLDHLKELQELSVKTYRINKGLDKI
jgi:hypothetical protein